MNGPPGPGDGKAALRAAAIAARDALPDAAALSMTRRVADIGLDLARAYDAKVVACYAAMGREAPVASLMARLHDHGFTVCLPVTGRKGTVLSFRRWTPTMRMAEGRMGILEPSADAGVVEPDLLFVPLAAFDRRGHRIGYGAGFYDRTLADLRARKRVVAVGVAFAAQETLFVPDEDHDAPLDMIVTETETILAAEAP